MSEEEQLSLYRDLARYPVLKDAYIVAEKNNSIVCESQWSTRNLSVLKQVGSMCTQVVTGEASSIPRHTPLLNNVVLIGRSGECSAMLVQSGGAGEKEETLVCYIFLQQPSQPSTIIDLSKTKLHGKVYSDGELGCLVFSPNSSQLAFVAEEHRPKPSSMLDPPSQEDEPSGRGQQFSRLPDWGEQFTGKHRSVVVVVPCKDTGSVPEKQSGRVVLNPPADYAGVGQLQWAEHNTLVGVAYIDASPRLGLIYCRIREAVIFHVSLNDGVFKELTPRGWWVGSPRLSPDNTRLVYLRGSVGGPHVREAQLVTRPWSSEPEIQVLEPRVVVDYVPSEVLLPEGGRFAGLTGASSLPLRCFIDKGNTLVFTTQGRFAMHSYTLDLESGSVVQVLQEGKGGSVQILDATAHHLLYTCSSFTSTPSLRLATVPSFQQDPVVLVESIRTVGEEELSVLDSPPPHPVPEYRDVPVPILYCAPPPELRSSSGVPLIVCIHGGPHSIVTNSFILSVSLFVSLGYAVVFPNYRGSLGVGSKGIHSLPGHCGDLDVKDCHAVMQDCLQRYDYLDSENVFLYGGSHGGYLVTFISAKYPEMYRAVSTRNPVTDMAGMIDSTDIPDWAHVEASTGESDSSPPSAAALAKMAAASPMWSIDSVRAPTLLMLGSQDRRVPSSQGWKYYELLKHRGIPTSVHVYPDNHALATVEHESENLLLTLRWFKKYAKMIIK
uniref:acylaminoacyl-peptidase n=1 Tax=Hirondellea gigas TaxID=1518452 RepID=A0A2P2I1R5_9CRUS